MRHMWPETGYKNINYILPDNLIKFIFVRTLFTLNWGIVYHGMLHHYIDYDFAKDYAKSLLEEEKTNNPLVSEIVKGMNLESIRILGTSCEDDGLVYEDFWLTIIVAWILKNKDMIGILIPRLSEIPIIIDPLKYIHFLLEIINNDFGCKKKTEYLTYYMPIGPTDGNRIIENLEDFVQKEVKRLNVLMKILGSIDYN